MSISARILVVDDDPAIRDVLARGLGNAGYQVTVAQDGRQALSRLRERDFQVVISDVKMPNLEGLETLAAIKKINPDVEVIMVTGQASVCDAVNAMKLGAYDFIQKPLELDVILALVEKALEKRELKAVVALHEISAALFQTIQLDALLAIAAKSTRALFRANDVLISLSDEGKLGVAAALGLEDEERLKSRLSLMERVSRETSALNPILENPMIMVCPMRVDGRTLGFLSVSRTVANDDFIGADLRHMAVLSSRIAQAIGNAKAFQSLRVAAGRARP